MIGEGHGAACGSAAAARIVLAERGMRVQLWVCSVCSRVICGRVLLSEEWRRGQLGRSADWLAQLVGVDLRDLVVGDERVA